MYDCIIVGAGPAGITAGLYLKRANKNIIIVYYGESNLEKASKIENYYGFENGISGSQLYANGIKQAQNLGIEMLEAEVTGIKRNEEKLFEVLTEKETITGKSVIIATGDKKVEPDIQGLKKFEGAGVSYCAICDGFFFRNKKLAVIGNGKFALEEANELKNVTDDITVLTNENPKIKEITGSQKVEKIIFEDGTEMNVDGIFVAMGVAGSLDFAKQLGIICKEGNIVVDENMKTNVDGVYAVGNIIGGIAQVSKAVYDGTKAGLAVINFINSVS